MFYAATGVMLTDSFGGTYSQMAATPGWYVNVRIVDGSSLPSILAPYEIFPTTPTRAFL